MYIIPHRYCNKWTQTRQAVVGVDVTETAPVAAQTAASIGSIRVLTRRSVTTPRRIQRTLVDVIGTQLAYNITDVINCVLFTNQPQFLRFRFYCRTQRSSGSMPECRARGPRSESRFGQFVFICDLQITQRKKEP